MAFSASEAAFEGFRVLRREPKTALVWAAFQLVTTVVAMLIMQPFLAINPELEAAITIALLALQAFVQNLSVPSPASLPKTQAALHAAAPHPHVH